MPCFITGSTQVEQISFGRGAQDPAIVYYGGVMKPIRLRCPCDCVPHSHQSAGMGGFDPLIGFSGMIVREV